MSKYDTHNPDNTPEDENMEWNGEYPELDASDEDNYDCEDDSWSDADSLASAGWGTDEDYGSFGDDW